jgi:hypothetical protein
MSTFGLSAAMFGVPIRQSNASKNRIYSGDRLVFHKQKCMWIENY